MRVCLKSHTGSDTLSHVDSSALICKDIRCHVFDSFQYCRMQGGKCEGEYIGGMINRLKYHRLYDLALVRDASERITFQKAF